MRFLRPVAGHKLLENKRNKDVRQELLDYLTGIHD
jgi:hypothetical protein